MSANCVLQRIILTHALQWETLGTVLQDVFVMGCERQLHIIMNNHNPYGLGGGVG